jgi:hypothetical protein
MPLKGHEIPGDGVAIQPPKPGDSDLDDIRFALTGIRFGEVRVILQDGVIVQIERIERRRFR